MQLFEFYSISSSCTFDQSSNTWSTGNTSIVLDNTLLQSLLWRLLRLHQLTVHLDHLWLHRVWSVATRWIDSYNLWVLVLTLWDLWLLKSTHVTIICLIVVTHLLIVNIDFHSGVLRLLRPNHLRSVGLEVVRFALVVESRTLFTEGLLTRNHGVLLIQNHLWRLTVVVLQRRNNILALHFFFLDDLVLNGLMSIWVDGLLASLHLTGCWDGLISAVVDALDGKCLHVGAGILSKGTKCCRVRLFDGCIRHVWWLESLLVLHVIDVSVHSLSILEVFTATFDWLLKHTLLRGSLRLLFEEIWQLFTAAVSSRSLRLLTHAGNVHGGLLRLVGGRSASSSWWFGDCASSSNSLAAIRLGSAGLALRFAQHLVPILHIDIGLSLLWLHRDNWFLLRFDTLFRWNFIELFLLGIQLTLLLPLFVSVFAFQLLDFFQELLLTLFKVLLGGCNLGLEFLLFVFWLHFEVVELVFKFDDILS